MALRHRRGRSQTRGGSIAAPRPVRWCRDHASPNRIQDHIPTEFQKIGLPLHHQAFETALQEMPDALMTPIKALGIATIQAPHAATQVGFGRFDQQMVVISHQAIGITAPALLEDFVTEQLQELLPVDIVMENGLLLVASSREVIERTGIFQAELASHDGGA